MEIALGLIYTSTEDEPDAAETSVMGVEHDESLKTEAEFPVIENEAAVARLCADP